MDVGGYWRLLECGYYLIQEKGGFIQVLMCVDGEIR